MAQTSQFAVRFYGTGTDQQDRVIFLVDDNAGGPDASTPLDVGAGSFTIELWLRGRLADNDTENAGGDVELPGIPWIDGNIFLDRDVWCGTQRDWGASIAGGFVRFGADTGDPPSTGAALTIEGDANVLDDAWHHLALVRDAASGRLHVYVDGAIDFSSSPGQTSHELSYPNPGVPVGSNCATEQLTPYGWFLVLAAEKHDAGPSFPSFDGFLDEVRAWSTARSSVDIAATWDRLVPADSAGLIANYRFEEGAGTVVADTSAAGSPDGDLHSGIPGNGEWVAWVRDPGNTAPILPLATIFADGFETGDTSAWSATSP
ncbi:MAG: LamG-like jellyroll fold domain-containing protein [Thermoanaerobaculia bacterium]